jgi:leucyl/phenylalanyl-tRNA--protein transferase
MPIYELPEDEIWFPSSIDFDGDIVAVGGDLDANRILSGYCRGIFPWYNDPGDILWWCPENRCVLFLDELHISHSMRNIINRGIYKVTIDRDFKGVLEGCRSGIRKDATWLLDEMVEAYMELHRLGYAHSVEVWQDGKLVGGLYGVSLGQMFYGESMFSLAPNSSKVGFIALVNSLKKQGWKLIDCQVYNDHLGKLGARNIPRQEFLNILKQEMIYETKVGPWEL